MVPMIVPDRYGISRRLTQYDRDVLHSTAVELLTVPLLGSAKRDVLKYCRLIWSIPVNKHYLTKRQVVALSFILRNYSAPFYTIYGVCNCRNTICRSPNRIFAVYHSDKDQPKPHM